MNDTLFNTNVSMPNDLFEKSENNVETAIKVLRETAETEDNQFDQELLEASAEKLEAEVL